MMTETEIAERAAIVIDGMYMFKTMRPRSVDGNKLSYVVYNDGCPYYSAPFERTTVMSFGG